MHHLARRGARWALAICVGTMAAGCAPVLYFGASRGPQIDAGQLAEARLGDVWICPGEPVTIGWFC